MSKSKLALLFVCMLGATGSAVAEVDVSTGLGDSRLAACKDAKDSAISVTRPYNFEITSFGSCECEKSTDSMWKCVVEYRSVHKKERR